MLIRRLCLLACVAVAAGAAASVLIRNSFSAHVDNGAAAALSPAPMASPAPTGIRQITLNTKDLVYDPAGQRIYASLPSTAANGNSIVQIDPFAGTVGTPVFIGSEPGKLAISDNSQYIYAGLDGAAAVRRFNIATQTPELQFTLGSDSFFGPMYVNDMEVMPGQPNTVAVSRRFQNVSPTHAGVGIYDNGVIRPTTTPTHTGANVIEFSSIASTLYGYNTESTEFGFRKMAINASGVTVVSTTTSVITGFGIDIRYANGLVYSSNGKVINPETGNPVGTFNGISFGTLVVPDPTANTIYFLTGSGSSTLVLKAFNLTTFCQTGSLSINGVSGTPGGFIKWGDDGLAFRTSGNQVFLFSTADIVSVTPTATPTPIAVASGITRLPLATNDIVYDAATQKVYASLPSAAGTFGNSIAPLDPQNSTMGTPVFIGSEPKQLAISNNGQYIYSNLTGASSIRRFDVPSQTSGLQFILGPIGFSGPMTADDLAVVPGNASAVAIARGNSGSISDSVAVFDDGVARANAAFGGNAIEFSGVASTLYGSGQSGLTKMTLASSGLTLTSTTNGLLGSIDMRYDNGRIYTTNGRVIDPEAGTILGTFPASGFVAPDSANGQVYFLITTFGSSTVTLRSFDPNTFTQTGTLTLTNVVGSPGSLIKAGSNMLAFRTESQVYFVALSALTSTAPTPIPSPTQVASGIIQLPVAANDLVYDPNTQKVYASLSGSAGSFGNSLAPIDPTTGNMSTPVFLGSEPRKLAISTNNQYIYAGLDGAAAVRRFDLASQAAGLQFSLGFSQFGGPRSANDMVVLAGSPGALAVSRRTGSGSPAHDSVAIYDDGVARPTTTGLSTLNDVIEPSDSAGKLYAYNNESSGFELRKLIVSNSGVTVGSAAATGIAGYGVDIKYDNGTIYSSNGRAVNPETNATVGTFSGVSSLAFVPDSSVKRVYFLTGSGGTTTLQAFDQTTFLSVGSLAIPGVSGTPTNLIRWGSNGLAFSTSGGQVYFVQTALIPAATKNVSVTSLTSSANPSTFGQSVTFTATVTSSAGNPTGTVQFQDNGVNLGAPQPLSAGMATLSTSSLAAGSRTITADYSGDANFLVSGASVNETVLPLLSINDITATEGQSGPKTVNFTVTLNPASNQPVTVNYSTAEGTATAGSDYAVTNGSLTFNPGDPLTKTISVIINSDQNFEPDETFFMNLSSPVNASISKAQGSATILNDDAEGGFISFNQGSYTASETTGFFVVTINRSNDTSRSASVDYATSDTGASTSCAPSNGLASSRCDFTTARGTLVFAPGETQKTFTVLINQDSYVEGTETFGIGLSNLTGGAILQGSATATGIIFNSANPPGTPANIVDDATFFVRQHYYDFLNRQPDQSGLDFWVNTITSCGGDLQCIDVKRINLSGAFFLSIEFQQTGYLVERLYKSAYGDGIGNSTFPSAHTLPVPIVRFNEFLADTQEIGRGVVVGQPGWEQQIENNKVAFINVFVQRSRFTSAFGSMGNAQYVDTLNSNAGTPLSPSERDQLVADLNSSARTRAQVLRAIAEHPNLVAAEFNRAFVLMQFFGYLRRNPDDPQDHDHTGYDFWLTKLNQFGGNFQNAEMVKAFITSDEYRHRFGP